jgi:hypothetical protein
MGNYILEDLGCAPKKKNRKRREEKERGVKIEFISFTFQFRGNKFY